MSCATSDSPSILPGPLACAPEHVASSIEWDEIFGEGHRDGWFYEFTGQGSHGRLLTRVVAPKGVVAPTGFDQGPLRAL